MKINLHIKQPSGLIKILVSFLVALLFIFIFWAHLFSFAAPLFVFYVLMTFVFNIDSRFGFLLAIAALLFYPIGLWLSVDAATEGSIVNYAYYFLILAVVKRITEEKSESRKSSD